MLTHRLFALFSGILILLTSCVDKTSDNRSREWPQYLGGPDRNHYSELDQINLSNVSELKIAWEYHTRDSGQIQCNPIIVNGILYGVTPTVQPFALDAATGKELWRGRDTASTISHGTSRGV